MADFTDDELTRRLQDEAQKRGVTFDQSDVQDVNRRDNSQAGLDMALRKYDTRATNTPNQDGGSNANQPPAQAWNNQAQSSQQGLYPDWYKELMTRNLDMQQQQQTQNTDRSNALYSTLDTRAKQGLAVNAQDPIISGQVDAFRAEQERAKRNDISNVAEQIGPYGNIRGEQRMAAERVGQNTSGFQAELMGRELSARRDEIAQALQSQGAMLSGDQTRALQSQLAAMDQAIKEANANTSATSVGNQFTLGQGQLALGQGQLALGNRGLDTSNDQFLRELGLRQWQLGDQSNFMWAGL